VEWSCLVHRFTDRGAFVAHANAGSTARTRERLTLLVFEDGWTYAAAAKTFMVNPRTAKKWARPLPIRRARGDVRPQLTAPEQPEQDTAMCRDGTAEFSRSFALPFTARVPQNIGETQWLGMTTSAAR
jgi:hypothetical protein